MQYLLMLYVDEAGWPRLTPAQQQQGMAAYEAYTQALSASSALVTNGRLQPSAIATTVRMAEGKARVRTIVTSAHSQDVLERAVGIIAKVAKRMKISAEVARSV